MPILTSLATSKLLITSVTAGVIALGGGTAAFTNITMTDGGTQPAVTAPTPSETPTATPSPSVPESPDPAPTTSAPAPAPSGPAPGPSTPAASAPAQGAPADDVEKADDAVQGADTEQGEDTAKPAPAHAPAPSAPTATPAPSQPVVVAPDSEEKEASERAKTKHEDDGRPARADRDQGRHDGHHEGSDRSGR